MERNIEARDLSLDEWCGHLDDRHRVNRELKALRAERDALWEKVETLRKGLKAVDDLINESDGVYGFHLNGDLSPWGDFLKGGDA